MILTNKYEKKNMMNLQETAFSLFTANQIVRNIKTKNGSNSVTNVIFFK